MCVCMYVYNMYICIYIIIYIYTHVWAYILRIGFSGILCYLDKGDHKENAAWASRS